MKEKRKNKNKLRVICTSAPLREVFILFFLININLFALDLEEARLLALANSRSLARYELAIRSSVLDERNQLYAMLPNVSASYSGNMNYIENWEFVNPPDTFTAGATLSITQILFQGGKGFIQKSITAIGTESTRIDALAEYFNVLDSIDNAYYAVLEAKAQLEAEESSLKSAELGYSIAEVRRSTGMITTGDYLKALADKEARENSFNQAKRSLLLSEAKFRSLANITGAVQLQEIDMSAYEEILIRLSNISDDEINLLINQFWSIISETNPSLAKAVLRNESAEKSLSLTKREASPTITATIFSTGLNYSARNQNNPQSQSSHFLGNGFTSTASGGVAIRGIIPLDFWILSNRIEKSKINRDSAALDYQNIISSLETELQSALLNICSQAGTVLSTRRSLEYTEKHYEFVMERYRLSQSSVSELTDASSLYIASRNNQIRATYAFLQNLSELRSMCALNDEGKLIEILKTQISTD